MTAMPADGLVPDVVSNSKSCETIGEVGATYAGMSLGRDSKSFLPTSTDSRATTITTTSSAVTRIPQSVEHAGNKCLSSSRSHVQSFKGHSQLPRFSSPSHQSGIPKFSKVTPASNHLTTTNQTTGKARHGDNHYHTDVDNDYDSVFLGSNNRHHDHQISLFSANDRNEHNNSALTHSDGSAHARTFSGRSSLCSDPCSITESKYDEMIQAKIQSLANIHHKPGGGNVVIYDEKLDFKERITEGKCRSLANVKHQPGGGNVEIMNEKIDLSGTKSKLAPIIKKPHHPSGGNVRIFQQKLPWLKHNKPNLSVEEKTRINKHLPTDQKKANSHSSSNA